MMIAQITDMHIRPRGKIAYGLVDTKAMLARRWPRSKPCRASPTW